MLVSFSFLVFHDYIYGPMKGILIIEVKMNRMIKKVENKKKGQHLSLHVLIYSTIIFCLFIHYQVTLLGDRHCVGAKKIVRRDIICTFKDLTAGEGWLITPIASVLMFRCSRSIGEGVTNLVWESWESLTEEMMLDWITNMRKKRDERHSRQEELLFQSLKYKAERG